MAIEADSDILATDVMGNIEVATGVTHSLVTAPNQKVMVWVKGNIQITSIGARTVDVTLKYNGTQKDIVQVYNENVTCSRAFALQYTETPGAATQNITVECAAGSTTLQNVVIMVLKSGE
jgi:hypothetical protein